MSAPSLCAATHSRPKELWSPVRALWRGWRASRIWHRRSTRAVAAAVLAEAGALLEGRAADVYAGHGVPIPGWTWLNALAHRPPEAILAMGIDCPGEVWSEAATKIAVELRRVGPADAAAIQTTVLLQAELDALRHVHGTPEAVVRAVRRHLETSRRHLGTGQ
ncbi:MAG: hypothetical protein ACRDWE_02590 [Acidimicrobiales bacterium]